MTIKPLGDMIFLEMEKANLGSLDTSSVKSAMEWATIKDLGPEVKDKTLKKGDKVFVKAWAIDSILYEGKDYFFTSAERKGICAIIK